MVVSDFKASKHDCILSKYDFFWVEGYAALAASVKPVDRLEETAFNGMSTLECIVDTFRFVWDIRNNVVKTSREAIARSNVSLRVGLLPVSSPRGNEGCEMTVVRVYSGTVATISAVKDTFFFFVGH